MIGDARAAARTLIVGRVTGVFGVRGWVKVFSETEPADNILRYSPWHLSGMAAGQGPRQVIEGRRHGKALIVRLERCADRDQAAALVGADIAVERSCLPAPGPDEFYWIDLEGLTVVTLEGLVLGSVSHLIATGANDVMVVRGERERLLPFVWDRVVKDVDFAARRLSVDWDPDF